MSNRFPLAKDEQGKCLVYAWPGGYPVFHAGADGSVYCAVCADAELLRAQDPDEYVPHPPAMSDVHWEGEPLQCDVCGREIESAYGVPEDGDA